MKLFIAAESPLEPAGRALIAASQEALLQVYGPDDIFSMSPEELAGPGITFYVAHIGQPVGCVASVDCADYAEVKRLFVGAAGRGKGIARALMERLEQDARVAGKLWVRLETGPDLLAAVGLYRSLGYVECGPFGAYPEHPASLFMEKRLSGG